MRDHHSTQRLDVFRQRAAFAPADVYRHRASGWEYIPVHPFGDEPDLLAQLALQPHDCAAVDAWWAIDGDATLLQTRVTRGVDDPSGLHAVAGRDPQRGVTLVAVVPAAQITRVIFEDVMARCAAAGFPDHPRFRLHVSDPPLRLDADASDAPGGASPRG